MVSSIEQTGHVAHAKQSAQGVYEEGREKGALKMQLCRVIGEAGPQFAILQDGVLSALEGDPFGEWREGGVIGDLASAELLPPVIPGTFYAAGLNYYHHIEEAKRKGNSRAVVPQRPDIGHRANNALIGHGAAIVRPADFEGRFEYEGEVVAVIGRRLKKAGRDEARDAIFGWTLGNDVSAREWQHGDRTMWRGKNSDSFKPMGPWIDTEADPMSEELSVIINGAVHSSYRIGGLIYDAVDFIVEISRYCTLSAGDVIWLGTDRTAGMAVGDLIEVHVPSIGTLGNKVVAEI